MPRYSNKEIQKIAEGLHKILCRWNHTDGCDWEYGGWSNPLWSHKKHYTKARMLFDLYKGDLEAVYKAIDAFMAIYK